MDALTPLWPAGHLPLNGGDQSLHVMRPTCGHVEQSERVTKMISPLEGEMAGGPEGGDRLRKVSA